MAALVLLGQGWCAVLCWPRPCRSHVVPFTGALSVPRAIPRPDPSARYVPPGSLASRMAC